MVEINKLTVTVPGFPIVEAITSSPESGVAHVACSDTLEGSMLYKLDNGMLLEFRWYADPQFTIGQEISWVKEGQGIRIFFEGGSDYLRGDFEHNSFVRCL